MGCLCGDQVFGGITDVHRLFYLVPLQKQGNVFPLVKAGPACRLMIIKQGG